MQESLSTGTKLTAIDHVLCVLMSSTDLLQGALSSGIKHNQQVHTCGVDDDWSCPEEFWWALLIYCKNRYQQKRLLTLICGVDGNWSRPEELMGTVDLM